MNRTITIALTVVLFVVGALLGNKIGAKNAELMKVKSGTALYEEPTAYADCRIIPKNIDAIVLEKVKYGAPTMVYINEDVTVDANNGAAYRLKQGSFFKFISINEADDLVTVMAQTEDNHNIHLDVPKSKVYPVDEGQWLRVRDKSFGDKWVRVKSSWYDNM